MTLSLSLSVCVLLLLSSLCVSARSFSLFSLNLMKGEEGKKNEEKEGERFCLVLKPYTLNNFFFKFN